MPSDLVKDLRSRFPSRVVPPTWDRDRYSHDAGMQWETPLAVATPRHEADVRELFTWCHRNDVPVTSRGAGSSIAGNAFGGGLVLDFSVHMGRVLEVREEPGAALVEPGAILGRVNRTLASRGRRIGPSPSSERFCTIGGMIGNNAAGSHGLRYGATAENLRAVRFLAADGSVHEWSRRRSLPLGADRDRLLESLHDAAAAYQEGRHAWDELAKNSSGYLLGRVGRLPRFDPQRILCASEGTLGIVTRATLATHPVPAHGATALAGFQSSEEALGAVPALLEARPAAVELLDEGSVEALVEHHPRLPDLARQSPCCLIVDVLADSTKALARDRERLQAALAKAPGFLLSEWATRPAARRILWEARRAIEPLLRQRPGRRRPLPFVEDVVVPVAQQVEYLRGLREILAAEGLEAPLYGHAGQGNLHVRPLLDPRSTRDRVVMGAVNEKVARLAKRLGGSLSGEHGDGYLRSRLLRDLFPDEYQAFRRLKQEFDPQELLNPGKIVESKRRVRPELFLEGPQYEPPVGSRP